MPHTILVPDDTRSRLSQYLDSLRTGTASAGKRLEHSLAGRNLVTLTKEQFLDALINTKVPQIFAESQVAGDGSDWNLTELRLLGDISIAVPVTIYDNGHRTAPIPHAEPFPGTLIFTSGALLRNDKGLEPADLAEVTRFEPIGNRDRILWKLMYYELYERRLLPVFRHIDEMAKAQRKTAFVTVPGLGCGQFAGPFQGNLGPDFLAVLEKFFERQYEHRNSFPNLKAVYFDPYNECSNVRLDIHGLSLMVRPLLQQKEAKPQLCHPSAYEERGDCFRDCMFFSIVAWDPVSWPGNDFFGGSRCTDDGVKAAATDSMAMLTGVEGRYDYDRKAYLPPPPFQTWEDVVRQKGARL